MKKTIGYLATLLTAALLGAPSAWAEGTTYYAQMTAKVADGNTGRGKVYASMSSADPAPDSYREKEFSTNGTEVVEYGGTASGVGFYVSAKPNGGYKFSNWTVVSPGSIADGDKAKASAAQVTVSAKSTTEGAPTEATATASFEKDEGVFVIYYYV